MSRLRRAAALAAVLAALLLLPGPGVRPPTVSLVRVGTASALDLADGPVWVLAVGSDADPDSPLESGRADAIQLVGLDVDRRRAVAIGVPRDLLVDVPGWRRDRINIGLIKGSPEVMADLVADLVGIAPQYVVVSRPEAFGAMVDAIGGLTVRSPYAFVDDERGLTVRRGVNRLDGDQAAAYAGSRVPLPDSDFSRSANHQRLLRAVLERVRAEQDAPGFLETAAGAALVGLDTDLSASEVYRFAHAVTEIDPGRVTSCVLGGRPITRFGADVLVPDEPQARRIAQDVRDDMRVDDGCR